MPGARSTRGTKGKTALLWVLAVLITVVSAVYQRISGPTYPVRGTVALGSETVELKLTRTHGGEGDQPIQIEIPNADVTGEIAWRRFPTGDPWETTPFRRDGEWLQASLPHQPAAGKIEYQVRLRLGDETAVFPERPAVTRFKGAVPISWLLLHIAAVFAGMLFANRAGLGALTGHGSWRRLAWTAALILWVGGFILGPIIQKFAFDAYWTGFPFGYDLTDNKMLIAGVAWAWALWRLRGSRSARISIVAAALITLVIFAIPHSAWGSQIDWDTMQGAKIP